MQIAAITLDIPEALAASLVLAVLTLAGVTIYLFVSGARYLTKVSDALSAAGDVNTALNKSVLQMIEERRQEREEQNQERRTWEGERAALLRNVEALRDETSQQVEQLNRQLADERMRRRSLEDEVQKLKMEGAAKDARIAKLEIALTQSEQDKAELAAERDEIKQVLAQLKTSLNGKADKCADTEQELIPPGESGEHTPPADGAQESVDKSAEAGETVTNE